MKIKKKYIYAGIGIIVVVIFISSEGFKNLIKRKIEEYRLKKQISQIQNENAELEKEIERLKNNRSYIEYIIRRDMGYLKPDEIEYRFIKK